MSSSRLRSRRPRNTGNITKLSKSRGAGANRLLAGARGFFAPTCSSARFSCQLTSSRGRKYITSVVKRGDSAPRAEIRHAVEKVNPIVQSR